MITPFVPPLKQMNNNTACKKTEVANHLSFQPTPISFVNSFLQLLLRLLFLFRNVVIFLMAFWLFINVFLQL